MIIYSRVRRRVIDPLHSSQSPSSDNPSSLLHRESAAAKSSRRVWSTRAKLCISLLLFASLLSLSAALPSSSSSPSSSSTAASSTSYYNNVHGHAPTSYQANMLNKPITHHQPSSHITLGGMLVTPSRIDFGATQMLIPLSANLELRNPSPSKLLDVISIQSKSLHYHIQGFEPTTLPPQGKIMVQVMFLPRSLGSIIGRIEIQTKQRAPGTQAASATLNASAEGAGDPSELDIMLHGSLAYRKRFGGDVDEILVLGQGLKNTYGIAPITDLILTVDSSISYPIHISNVDAKAILNIQEVFTTESYLQLGLPEADKNGDSVSKGTASSSSSTASSSVPGSGGSPGKEDTVNSLKVWEVPPATSNKHILNLMFSSGDRTPGFYGGYIHVHTDRHFLILPIHITVLAEPLRFSPSEIHFGTMRMFVNRTLSSGTAVGASTVKDGVQYTTTAVDTPYSRSRTVTIVNLASRPIFIYNIMVDGYMDNPYDEMTMSRISWSLNTNLSQVLSSHIPAAYNSQGKLIARKLPSNRNFSTELQRQARGFVIGPKETLYDAFTITYSPNALSNLATGNSGLQTNSIRLHTNYSWDSNGSSQAPPSSSSSSSSTASSTATTTSTSGTTTVSMINDLLVPYRVRLINGHFMYNYSETLFQVYKTIPSQWSVKNLTSAASAEDDSKVPASNSSFIQPQWNDLDRDIHLFDSVMHPSLPEYCTNIHSVSLLNPDPNMHIEKPYLGLWFPYSQPSVTLCRVSFHVKGPKYAKQYSNYIKVVFNITNTEECMHELSRNAQYSSNQFNDEQPKRKKSSASSSVEVMHIPLTMYDGNLWMQFVRKTTHFPNIDMSSSPSQDGKQADVKQAKLKPLKKNHTETVASPLKWSIAQSVPPTFTSSQFSRSWAYLRTNQTRRPDYRTAPIPAALHQQGHLPLGTLSIGESRDFIVTLHNPNPVPMLINPTPETTAFFGLSTSDSVPPEIKGNPGIRQHETIRMCRAKVSFQSLYDREEGTEPTVATHLRSKSLFMDGSAAPEEPLRDLEDEQKEKVRLKQRKRSSDRLLSLSEYVSKLDLARFFGWDENSHPLESSAPPQASTPGGLKYVETEHDLTGDTDNDVTYGENQSSSSRRRGRGPGFAAFNRAPPSASADTPSWLVRNGVPKERDLLYEFLYEESNHAGYLEALAMLGGEVVCDDSVSDKKEVIEIEAGATVVYLVQLNVPELGELAANRKAAHQQLLKAGAKPKKVDVPKDDADDSVTEMIDLSSRFSFDTQFARSSVSIVMDFTAVSPYVELMLPLSPGVSTKPSPGQPYAFNLGPLFPGRIIQLPLFALSHFREPILINSQHMELQMNRQLESSGYMIESMSEDAFGISLEATKAANFDLDVSIETRRRHVISLTLYDQIPVKPKKGQQIGVFTVRIPLVDYVLSPRTGYGTENELSFDHFRSPYSYLSVLTYDWHKDTINPTVKGVQGYMHVASATPVTLVTLPQDVLITYFSHIPRCFYESIRVPEADAKALAKSLALWKSLFNDFHEKRLFSFNQTVHITSKTGPIKPSAAKAANVANRCRPEKDGKNEKEKDKKEEATTDGTEANASTTTADAAGASASASASNANSEIISSAHNLFVYKPDQFDFSGMFTPRPSIIVGHREANAVTPTSAIGQSQNPHIIDFDLVEIGNFKEIIIEVAHPYEYNLDMSVNFGNVAHVSTGDEAIKVVPVSIPVQAPEEFDEDDETVELEVADPPPPFFDDFNDDRVRDRSVVFEGLPMIADYSYEEIVFHPNHTVSKAPSNKPVKISHKHNPFFFEVLPQTPNERAAYMHFFPPTVRMVAPTHKKTPELMRRTFFKVVFSPISAGRFQSVFLLRNNFTRIEAVLLKGHSTRGTLSFHWSRHDILNEYEETFNRLLEAHGLIGSKDGQDKTAEDEYNQMMDINTHEDRIKFLNQAPHLELGVVMGNKATVPNVTAATKDVTPIPALDYPAPVSMGANPRLVLDVMEYFRFFYLAQEENDLKDFMEISADRTRLVVRDDLPSVASPVIDEAMVTGSSATGHGSTLPFENFAVENNGRIAFYLVAISIGPQMTLSQSRTRAQIPKVATDVNAAGVKYGKKLPSTGGRFVVPSKHWNACDQYLKQQAALDQTATAASSTSLLHAFAFHHCAELPLYFPPGDFRWFRLSYPLIAQLVPELTGAYRSSNKDAPQPLFIHLHTTTGIFSMALEMKIPKFFRDQLQLPAIGFSQSALAQQAAANNAAAEAAAAQKAAKAAAAELEATRLAVEAARAKAANPDRSNTQSSNGAQPATEKPFIANNMLAVASTAFLLLATVAYFGFQRYQSQLKSKSVGGAASPSSAAATSKTPTVSASTPSVKSPTGANNNGKNKGKSKGKSNEPTPREPESNDKKKEKEKEKDKKKGKTSSPVLAAEAPPSPAPSLLLLSKGKESPMRKTLPVVFPHMLPTESSGNGSNSNGNGSGHAKSLSKADKLAKLAQEMSEDYARSLAEERQQISKKSQKKKKHQESEPAPEPQPAPSAPVTSSSDAVSSSSGNESNASTTPSSPSHSPQSSPQMSEEDPDVWPEQPLHVYAKKTSKPKKATESSGPSVSVSESEEQSSTEDLAESAPTPAAAETTVASAAPQADAASSRSLASSIGMRYIDRFRGFVSAPSAPAESPPTPSDDGHNVQTPNSAFLSNDDSTPYHQDSGKHASNKKKFDRKEKNRNNAAGFGNKASHSKSQSRSLYAPPLIGPSMLVPPLLPNPMLPGYGVGSPISPGMGAPPPTDMKQYREYRKQVAAAANLLAGNSPYGAVPPNRTDRSSRYRAQMQLQQQQQLLILQQQQQILALQHQQIQRHQHGNGSPYDAPHYQPLLPSHYKPVASPISIDQLNPPPPVIIPNTNSSSSSSSLPATSSRVQYDQDDGVLDLISSIPGLLDNEDHDPFDSSASNSHVPDRHKSPAAEDALLLNTGPTRYFPFMNPDASPSPSPHSEVSPTNFASFYHDMHSYDKEEEAEDLALLNQFNNHSIGGTRGAHSLQPGSNSPPGSSFLRHPGLLTTPPPEGTSQPRTPNSDEKEKK